MLLLPYSGKAHDLYFRHYTNKQGLSHNTVYCALQDKKGFMWFGTDDGLNRFDGHQFRIYRYNSYDPESLPNDRIISLFEDSTGYGSALTPTPVTTTIKQMHFTP